MQWRFGRDGNGAICCLEKHTMISYNAHRPKSNVVFSSVLALMAISSFAGTPHPIGLYSKWLEKNVSELVRAYGQPDAIVETTVRGFVIYGDTPSVMYVYSRNPEFGDGCIAAYVIELQTGKILRYQCR